MGGSTATVSSGWRKWPLPKHSRRIPRGTRAVLPGDHGGGTQTKNSIPLALAVDQDPGKLPTFLADKPCGKRRRYRIGRACRVVRRRWPSWPPKEDPGQPTPESRSPSNGKWVSSSAGPSPTFDVGSGGSVRAQGKPSLGLREKGDRADSAFLHFHLRPVNHNLRNGGHRNDHETVQCTGETQHQRPRLWPL